MTDDGSSIQDSFFSAVTQDDGNVYFTLTDGSVITVAKRTDFYLILRKAPDVAPFVYGETKTYEIESAGVAETILTKPDGWRVALKDDVLSVTAPAADAAGFEAEGTVAVIYFDGAERSSVAKLGVVVDKSQTGVTEGDDFTIDITGGDRQERHGDRHAEGRFDLLLCFGLQRRRVRREGRDGRYHRTESDV